MKYVEVVVAAGSAETIERIAEKAKAEDCRRGVEGEDGQLAIRMLVSNDKLQWVLDALQHILGAQPSAKVLVLPVEAHWPRRDSKSSEGPTASREALYHSVERSARLNRDYLLLVVLSTFVAAIGLVENNVAVIIGAMVIAPLLGPNLALSLGTALGDLGLVREAAVTLVVGILLAMAISFGLGYFWLEDLSSSELMARTLAGWDTVALALASGAAAALSLSTGLSSVLVGVMVAVALLPPAATVGLLLGYGEPGLALGAALLLAVNVVCVNLASKTVFFFKGVNPRTWLEKETARRAMRVYLAGWLVLLTVLMLVIYARGTLVAGTGL